MGRLSSLGVREALDAAARHRGGVTGPDRATRQRATGRIRHQPRSAAVQRFLLVLRRHS